MASQFVEEDVVEGLTFSKDLNPGETEKRVTLILFIIQPPDRNSNFGYISGICQDGILVLVAVPACEMILGGDWEDMKEGQIVEFEANVEFEAKHNRCLLRAISYPEIKGQLTLRKCDSSKPANLSHADGGKKSFGQLRIPNKPKAFWPMKTVEMVEAQRIAKNAKRREKYAKDRQAEGKTVNRTGLPVVSNDGSGVSMDEDKNESDRSIGSGVTENEVTSMEMNDIVEMKKKAMNAKRRERYAKAKEADGKSVTPQMRLSGSSSITKEEFAAVIKEEKNERMRMKYAQDKGAEGKTITPRMRLSGSSSMSKEEFAALIKEKKNERMRIKYAKIKAAEGKTISPRMRFSDSSSMSKEEFAALIKEKKNERERVKHKKVEEAKGRQIFTHNRQPNV